MTEETIFKIQTDGSGFNLLHVFAGVDDGREAHGSLILSGSTLYGMTEYGGDSDAGTIFKVQNDGSGYTLLHEFAFFVANGYYPQGSLTIFGSNLYGMTYKGGNSGYGVIFSLPLSTITVTSPNGGENWNVGSSHDIIWSSTGTIANVNIDYSINSGTNWASVVAGTANDGSYTWTVPATPSTTCLVRISDAANGAIFDTSNAVFTISAIPTETVSTPNTPSGPATGTINTSYDFTTGGSTSSLGHALQYKFNWGDGSDSGWLAQGTISASHAWTSNDTFHVRAMARCVSDTGVESLWSAVHDIIISGISRVDFIGTWDDQGVYYRNSLTGLMVKLATPATLITAGDLDGDGIDDLIGIWPGQGGVWVKYSATGAWAKLSSTARDISSGDMNGDGRVDLVATWDGQGVYYRNSIGGAWVKMATPAEQVTAGDLDGDGKADLIGIWPAQGGVWVKYSQSGSWAKLSTTAIDIACNDMNGDGRDDLVATWDGQGVYYRNSLGGAWVMMATPATLVTAGDLDGDNKADVIGIWPGQGGVWVKYSQSGSWAQLSTTTARHIATGLMRGGAGSSPTLLAEPFGGVAAGPGDLGYQDMAATGPGDRQFQCQEEKNLTPQQDVEAELQRVPGPGEYGFQCLEQKNLVPGSGNKKETKGKEQHQQQ
jgi:uncharacterized repeat protein (TIGR03803 family)